MRRNARTRAVCRSARTHARVRGRAHTHAQTHTHSMNLINSIRDFAKGEIQLASSRSLLPL